MKWKVVGWTSYSDSLKQGNASWAAYHAIVDDVKNNGYLFSGWAHQEGYLCAPVLNDGKIYRFSQRGWGGIMAEAHGYTNRMDYAKFAFMIDREYETRPTAQFDKANFKKERKLNEHFEVSVSSDALNQASNSNTVKLDDLTELRYLDAGDKLTLICGDKSTQYIVESVDRQKDLPDEELDELEFAMYCYRQTEKGKAAEEKYNKTKTVIIAKLKQ